MLGQLFSWFAAFVVVYAVEFLCLSAAKLMVLAPHDAVRDADLAIPHLLRELHDFLDPRPLAVPLGLHEA